MSKKETKNATAEQKVLEIAKDYKKLDKKGQAIVIDTEEHYESANAFLIEVKGRINRVKALQDEYVTPIKESIKNLEKLFKDPIKNYESIEDAVKASMGTFRLAQNEIQRKADEKARKEREELEAEQKRKEDEQRKKEAEAKKKGEKAPAPLPPEPVPVPVVATPKPKANLKTDAGSSTESTEIKFEVEDATVLPKKYKDLVYDLAVKKGLVEQVMRPVIKTEGMKCKIKGIRVYEHVNISVKA